MCNATSQLPIQFHFPPQKLTKEEITDPYKVLYDLFDFAHLPRIRELLWEFFKTAVTGNYTHELQRRERSLMVMLYEKIEKLVEAAHIINEKQKQVKRPVFDTYPFAHENIIEVNLKSLTSKIEGLSQAQLQAIVEIVIRVTDAEKLFLAGVAKNSNNIAQLDFLALLPPNAKYTYAEYQTQVQSKCNKFGSVLLWCSKINEVSMLLREGHIFYTSVCRSGLMLYDNGRLSLLQKREIDITAIKLKARNSFNESFAIAKSFLDGAEYYTSTEQQKPAVFLSHQAAEHALRALLGSLTAYTAYGHNLQSLLRRCAFCAPELGTTFPQNTPEEKKLFNLLNTAYVYSRYKTTYEINQSELMLVLDRVNTLVTEVEQFFEEKLIAFESMLLYQNG